ncbi:MAG: glycosyltransferase [Janthinobacterium lividum]
MIAPQAGHRPRVSVAMCTFNGSRFLPAQLDSIAAQTVAPDELVVQDDGSDDGSAALIERFAAQAPFPVRLVVNAQRLRPARNFGACIARCTGDIILLTDQDDVWLSDRIERTITAYDDPEVAFTFSDAPLIDADGQLLGRTIFDTVPVSPADRVRLTAGHDLLPLILRYGVLYGTTMSVRYDVAAASLPIADGWSHDEWLSLVGAALGRSKRMEPVTRYRQHASQVVGSGEGGLHSIVVGAQNRPERFYITEQARYEAAVRTIEESSSLAATLRPIFEVKLAFIAARQSIHRGGVAGFGLILRQIANGNYTRFAGGARSIAKDTALAVRATLKFRRAAN